METDTTTCPECSGTSMVDTARGLTCDTCGLVIDEGQTFVVQEQLGKNGAIHAHEILHGNTTTIIGTKRERMTNAGAKLALLQRRIVSYDETKRSSTYHILRGATHGLQLPTSIIDHAMHVNDKLAMLVERGSMLAGVEVLAAMSLYIAAKRLGIALHKDAMLDVFGLDRKHFDRCLLRIKAIGKVACVPAGKQMSRVIFEHALAAAIAVAGEGHHAEAIEMAYKTLARAFVGLHEDSIVAVTAYMALQLEGCENASLSAVASATGYRSASLYNAATRVLRKFGIVIEKSLSKLDIAACLREIVPMGNGIMKDAPVPVVSVETPAIVVIQTEPEVEPGEMLVIKPLPVVRPTMTRSIPVSTNASPSRLVARRLGAERPPRSFYTNNNALSNVSRELFIAVRHDRGRYRNHRISKLAGFLDSNLQPYRGAPGPPIVCIIV